MATRVNKAGSAQKEFALAPQPLHIADLDTDLDAIFTSIDNTNIIAGAAISTLKIAPDGGIVTGHLAANAVTQAKTAAGAAVNAETDAAASVINLNNGEATVLTLPAINTRGGRVLLIPFVIVSVQLNAGVTGAGLCQVKWKRDGGTIFTMDFSTTPSATVSNYFALTIPPASDLPPAGAHTYTATVVSGNTGINMQISAGNLGRGFAVELS